MTESTPEYRRVHGYINPLAFHEVEEPWILLPDHKPVCEADLLRYLVQPNFDASLESIVARYLEISREENDRIFVAPTGILRMLAWPLRYAKGSYALGNFIATLALCGTASEMATILMFEAHNLYWGEPAKKGKLIGENAKYYAHDGFVKARQVDRVHFLLRLKIITTEVKGQFDLIRQARRRHLHLRPASRDVAAKDAVVSYLAAVKIVNYALGLGTRDGKLTLRPEIIAWLDAQPDHDSSD